MARNIRWRCSFKSLKGVSCVINIYDNNWSGGIVSVTGADDPFYYEEDNSDDILNEVIRYRTGYIRLVEQGVFGALKDIYPTSTFDRFVEVLYDGAVVFNGYIQVQDFSNDLVPNPRVIELPVISPLGLCEKLRFNAIIPPVTKTLGELLDIMLLQVYQKVVVPDMNGTDLSQTVMSLFVSPWNDDYWHSMTTQTWSKVMSPETYDVLIDGICKAFGWICHDTPTALVFTSFEHRGNYISYPSGHIGEAGYGTTVSIPSSSQLTTYFNPADDEANVSTIQPDTGIEISYDGEFGSIKFEFDRTYFGGVEMIDPNDPREIFSFCNLIPIDGLFEVNDVGTLSFDSSGKVNIGKACVAWNGNEGVLVSLGSAPSGSILFKVRYYTKKISGNGWTLSYDLMTSMRNISQLKRDEDNIKDKYIGTSLNRQDNYVEITFNYYYINIDPLPSQYLLFFHNIKLEALAGNEPYAKYKYLQATDSDKIPDTNPPISSSITMPISKYRLNDRLIGDVLRTDKITEYPYLFQPRQNMIHKFKTTSSSVPELFHAMLFSYFNNNWRIIAQDFHPWDDEYTLTLQNSPILDSSPGPGPSPDPGPTPTPTPETYSDILDAMNTVLQRNSISTITDGSKADIYLKYMFNEAELEWNDSGSALFSTDTYPELYPIHGNISLYQDTAHTAMQSWLMAMCLSELVPTSGETNVQTQLFKCAYDLGGGASIPIYGSYTMRGDVNIARLAAAAVYHSLHDIYVGNGTIADCRSQLGNHTIQADDWEGLGNTRRRNPDRSTGQPAIGYDVLSNGYVVNAEKFLLSTPGPRVAGTYAASRPLPYGEGKQPASMFNSDNNYTMDANVDTYMVSNYNMMAQTQLSTWQGYNTEKKNRLIQVGTIPSCTKMYMFGLQIPVKLHLDNGQLPIVQGYPRYVFEQDFASNTLHLDGPFSDLSNLYHFVTVEATDPSEAASEIQSKRLPFEKWLDSVTDIADNARWPVYNPNYGRRRPGCADAIAGGPRSATPGAAENEIYNVSLTQMTYDDSYTKRVYEDEDGFASDPPASYPSGHSAQIYTLALMLGQMDPTRIVRWMRRAYEYAEGRSIGRYHWYSDVMYGRLFATMTTPILNAMSGSTFRAGYEATKASVLRGTTVISINIRIRNNTANYVSLDGDINFILDNTGARRYGWTGIYNRTGHIRFSNESLRMNPGESRTFYNLIWSDSFGIYENDTLVDEWILGLKGRSPLDPTMLPTSYPRNVQLYQGGDSSIVLANNMDHSIVFAEGGTYDIVIT